MHDSPSERRGDLFKVSLTAWGTQLDAEPKYESIMSEEIRQCDRRQTGSLGAAIATYTQGSGHSQGSALGVGISGAGFDVGYTSQGTHECEPPPALRPSGRSV